MTAAGDTNLAGDVAKFSVVSALQGDEEEYAVQSGGGSAVGEAGHDKSVEERWHKEQQAMQV